MWENELCVAFRKGEHFENAIETACVPLDCIGEAADLWAVLRLAEWHDYTWSAIDNHHNEFSLAA